MQRLRIKLQPNRPRHSRLDKVGLLVRTPHEPSHSRLGIGAAGKVTNVEAGTVCILAEEGMTPEFDAWSDPQQILTGELQDSKRFIEMTTRTFWLHPYGDQITPLSPWQMTEAHSGLPIGQEPRLDPHTQAFSIILMPLDPKFLRQNLRRYCDAGHFMHLHHRQFSRVEELRKFCHDYVRLASR